MMNEEEQRPEITRTTYDYLRWLLILIPALLLVVTIVAALQQGELERSISAYYGGPVRDIFVGALFAIAACLIAYQGVGLLEDYALNGAGFYAVFVALVPTGFAGLMNELRQNPIPGGVEPALIALATTFEDRWPAAETSDEDRREHRSCYRPGCGAGASG